ncbi:Ig-like domain-containing protein [Avibacterium sp. 21-599]|uniref:Ig-like domain-containing protein n=1 Tax=Avibacterium sp. 21-599 TaxID=2911528 RepID=UPI002245277F|nr:YqiA/YcfP family alpha/beta fold hydrolase [Avibacterium sp. 21-599]MCW9717511.1 Ig-like domain-containing protein [Avibacterium sp. 21-599]
MPMINRIYFEAKVESQIISGLELEEIKFFIKKNNDLEIILVNGDIITIQDYFLLKPRLFIEKQKSDLIEVNIPEKQYIEEYTEQQFNNKFLYNDPIHMTQPSDTTFLTLASISTTFIATSIYKHWDGKGNTYFDQDTDFSTPINANPTTDINVTHTLAAPVVQNKTPDGLHITGTAEVGATVIVKSATGTELGRAGTNQTGQFDVTLTTAQKNGERLVIMATDKTNNSSAEKTFNAIDRTAPAVPIIQSQSNDGLHITGTAEAGATVIVKSATGTELGRAGTNQTGQFDVTLTTAQKNGERLVIMATDKTNNSSAEKTFNAIDRTAPAVPIIQSQSNDGLHITGTAEAGSTVIVKSATGTELGRAGTNQTGQFDVTLTTAQKNGERLVIMATDKANNSSAEKTFNAIDRTAPAVPTIQSQSNDGLHITGTAEAGSTVIVKSATGTELGRASTNQTGQFDVTLTTAQKNGERLVIMATDKANNSSAEKTFNAIDRTAPAVPTIQSQSNDGLHITGTAEAGSTVIVKSATGTELGRASTNQTGQFDVRLTTAQKNGERLVIMATDKANNSSAEKAFSATESLYTKVYYGDGTILTLQHDQGTALDLSSLKYSFAGNTSLFTVSNSLFKPTAKIDYNKDTDHDGLIDLIDKDPTVWNVSDRDLRFFARLSYSSDKLVNNVLNGKQSIIDSQKINKLNNAASYSEISNDWEVITLFHDSTSGLDYSLFGNGKYTNSAGKTAYHNIVIAFPGTKGGVFSVDGSADLKIGAGGVPAQAKKAAKEIPSVVLASNPDNIYVTGESLGGYLAQYLMTNATSNFTSLVRHTAIFNPAIIKAPSDIATKANDLVEAGMMDNSNLSEPRSLNKTNSYVIKGEFVSNLQGKYKNTTEITGISGSPTDKHDMGNFFKENTTLQKYFTVGNRMDDYYLNPYKQDSDNDGFSDAIENILYSDRNNPNSLPVLQAIVTQEDKNGNVKSAQGVTFSAEYNTDQSITFSVAKDVAYTNITNFSKNALPNFVSSNKSISFEGTMKDDRIIGSEGQDVLWGNKGSDTLTGGAGKDVFVFKASDIGQGVDSITDFKTKEDRLDLSGLRSLLGTNPNLSIDWKQVVDKNSVPTGTGKAYIILDNDAHSISYQGVNQDPVEFVKFTPDVNLSEVVILG